MTRAILFVIAMLATWALARAEVPAPQSIVIVACRVDDLTGQPGRHDPTLAAKDWRDLELKAVNGAYQCKHQRLDLEDGAIWGPNPPKELIPLVPDFGDFGQCARVGVMQTADWNRKNPGWAVVGVGCPVPIVADADADGYPDMDEHGRWKILDWKLPGCPSHLPGMFDPAHPENNRMKCDFDESAI